VKRKNTWVNNLQNSSR